MISAERTGFVAAPPAHVWAALADFALISTWAANVDHSCLLTELDAGVGTARRIQTARTTLVETVTTWTPPTDTTRGPPEMCTDSVTQRTHRRNFRSGVLMLAAASGHITTSGVTS